MNASAWKPVGTIDAGNFAEARRQAHNAAQWLVRVAHSFMPASSDNRHTPLHWDAESAALVTQEFVPSLTLELRLPGLAMQFREEGRPAPHVFEFDDRTPAEAEAWVLVELLHRCLDRERFSKALPYDFPDLMTGDAVSYVVEPVELALRQLAAWFSNAAMVLGRVAEEYPPAEGGRLDVSCWPQMLHLGILLGLDEVGSRSRRMLRVAWSPGDQKQATPYFYVRPHHPGAMALESPASRLAATELAASEDPTTSALEYLRAEIARHRAGI